MIVLMTEVKGIENTLGLVYAANKALASVCGYATFMGPEWGSTQRCTVFLHIHNPEDMLTVSKEVVSGVTWSLVTDSYQEYHERSISALGDILKGDS
jgi:hypothetical protein